MCESQIRSELPLVASDASGCSCCSTGAASEPKPADSATEYPVEGLSCGHCVQSVEKAVAEVPGVQSVSVDLVSGGVSSLRVSGLPDPAAIRAAVVGAGYHLSER
ncbi:heavy-metal-associated domain-containing protein [Arthrobacter sp. NPDC090010]|uniref:heavy-metal-associated domain-containing protein n=1 Tax=Arthrobacter sp. NPDC090010 TaxID=3363942 RepID=UPI003828C722